MKKRNYGFLAAGLALAIATPIGARQLLTLVKGQGVGTAQEKEFQLNEPALMQGQLNGRADVQSYGIDENADATVRRVPRTAENDIFYRDFPNAEAATDFTIIDANNDGRTWVYSNANKVSVMRILTGQTETTDDWLITPAIDMEAGKAYELDLEIGCWEPASYSEFMEVKAGTNPTVAGMTQEVIPMTQIEFKYTAPGMYKAYVYAATAGKYYIGVHAKSEVKGQAIHVFGLGVKQPVSGNAPARVTDLKVEDSGKNDGNATVSCTAPTKTLSGNNLTSITKMEFWRGYNLINTIENPTPGQKISFVDLAGGGENTWKVFVSNADGTSFESVYTASIVGPHSIPYYKDFPKANSLDDMTIIDANEDGSTWGWDQYSFYAKLSCAKEGDDDWLITPPLILKAGKVYEFGANVSCGNPTNYPPIMEVKLGKAPTVAGMTQEVFKKTQFGAYDNVVDTTFTVAEDGLYYLGIHGCSEKWLALIKLMNFSISGGASEEGPAKVEDVIVEPDWSGRNMNAYISFTAPSKNGLGQTISGMEKIEIQRNGVTIHTFNNVVSGQKYSYVDPVGQGGEYTYRIFGTNDKGQGATVEETINIGVPGKEVPYLEDFSDADRFAALYKFDVNGDGTNFWHATMTTPPYAWVHWNGDPTSTSDDYLITPGITLKEGTKYRISADAWGYNEGFALYVGTAPRPDSLSTTIVPVTLLPENQATFSGEFTPPYTGKFYVGIRNKTEAGNRATDFHVTNIRVDRIGSFDSPAYVDNFTPIADPNGEAKITFKFNAPTKNMDGSALTALDSIIITRGAKVVKKFDNPAPGAAFEYVDAPGSVGEFTYTFSAYSAAGQGQILEYIGYTGIDIPATPQNVVATDIGNGQVKITWDPVTTTAHGAVIPKAPTYVVLESDAENEKQLGQTTKCEYTYQATSKEDQKRFFYAIFPFNAQGDHNKEYGRSNDVFVGDAYPLQFLESFENGGHTSPIVIENLIFEPAWSLCTDASFTNVIASDGDNGFIAEKGYPTNKGWMYTGKISLKNAVSPTLSFNAYNIKKEDYMNEMTVFVKEVGSDEWTEVYSKAIREAVPATGWGRISVDLAPWKGKEIHIAFMPTTNYCEAERASYYAWTIFDAIRVHNLTNNDLGANIAVSAEAVDAGDDIDITVTVSNNGENEAASFTVDLYKDGKVVDSVNGTKLASGRSEKFVFPQTLNVSDNDQVEYYAVVTFKGDENAADNTSKKINVTVNKPIYPAVNTLKGEEVSNGTIELTWSAPSMDNVPPTPYKETFEDAASYNLTGVKGWTFVDVDQEPVGGFQQFSFPGITTNSTKAAFFVVDNTATELGDYASLFAGNAGSKKFIGSLLSYSGTPDDWAISPELYGGAQIISFYGKNLQDNMPEKVEVWYSTGSTDPKDFIKVKQYDITNTAWTKYTAYLPAGAKRLAIRHNYQGAIMMVDDIEFRRTGDTPESLTLKGYNVYRDGEKINEELVTEPRFRESGVEKGEHVYAVNPVYDKGEGNAVRTTVTSNSVNGLDMNSVMVSGGNGVINVANAAGLKVAVLTLDGKAISNAVANNNYSVLTPAGVYIVRVANKTYKVVVK